MNLNQIFLNFGLCIPVRGYRRSLLHDLQRSKVYYIPNDLCEILINERGKPISQIIKTFGSHNKQIILEYIEFLKVNELIFFCEQDEVKYFTPIEQNWNMPAHITNAIIAYNGSYDLINLIFQLTELGCNNLQIYLLNQDLGEISELFKCLNTSTLRFIEIFLKDSEYSLDFLKGILVTNIRFRKLVLFDSKRDQIIKGGDDGEGDIVYTSKSIESYKYNSPAKTFILNLDFFTEAILHNPYYNRKIAISYEGEILNCLSNHNTYGHISNKSISEVIKSSDFKNIWYLCKDKIDICKDCEHRYICLDGRTPVYNGKSWQYSTECNYNPYIAKWNGEENYQPVM